MRHQRPRRIRKEFSSLLYRSVAVSFVQDPYLYQEHDHNCCVEEGHIDAVDESGYWSILEHHQFCRLRRRDYSRVMRGMSQSYRGIVPGSRSIILYRMPLL